jgi:hypothetical protein
MSEPDGGDSHRYEVGYRRPPTEHRFQKGKSGNPTGKSKLKARKKIIVDDIMSVFLRESRKPVVIVENGKSITLTMNEAIMRRLVHSAAKGELAALKQYVILKREADIRTSEMAMPEADEMQEMSSIELMNAYKKFVQQTTPR